jgi:hypothetical protein
VSPANVIVTNATTGVEIPGSLQLGPSGTQVVFTPSAPLPFGTALGIRVQNLLSVDGTVPLNVTVCNVSTEAAPISELFWDVLEPPTGTQLTGASLFAQDSGWVASFNVPLYRRKGLGWELRFQQPYYAASYDVDFVSSKHGWATHFDTRGFRGVITRSVDGGINFDTVFTLGGQTINRLWMDSLRSNNRLFGVAGGGTVAQATFLKYNAATSSFNVTSTFASFINATATANVNDIDFSPNDTLNGAAVSTGVRVNASTTIIRPGRVFVTTNAGQSWSEVPGTKADTTNVITYMGVARRGTGPNADIYVTGGNGFFGRLVGGVGPMQRINLGPVSTDSTTFTALIYTDVEFAPDNPLYGWVIGAQLTEVVNGVPKYQGLIFRTKDGGATWVRQGVRGAAAYGAEFPALNRLEVFSSTNAWIVGDGGIVLSLNQ